MELLILIISILTYEENKTWISCFGNDRVSCCLDVLCRQCLKLQYTIQRDLHFMNL